MFIATCFDSCKSSSGYTRTIFMACMVFVHILGSQPAYRNVLKLSIYNNMVKVTIFKNMILYNLF